MFKSFLRWMLIFVVCHIVTYEFAGIIAYLLLGSSEFYPPSVHALDYLRNPYEIAGGLILGAQVLRGILFALVLFPFRESILRRGAWSAALTTGGAILVLGYIAASGGLIEHFVFFTESAYPAKFAAITLVEVTIQTALLGALIVWLERRFAGQPSRQPLAQAL